MRLAIRSAFFIVFESLFSSVFSNQLLFSIVLFLLSFDDRISDDVVGMVFDLYTRSIRANETAFLPFVKSGALLYAMDAMSGGRTRAEVCCTSNHI